MNSTRITLLLVILLWTHGSSAYINCDNSTDTFWLRSDELSMNFEDGPSFKLEYYNGTSSSFYLKMTFNTILESQNDTNSWDFSSLNFTYDCSTQLAPWNNTLVYSDTIAWTTLLENGATLELEFTVYSLGTNITGFYSNNGSLNLDSNSFGMQFSVFNWVNTVNGSKAKLVSTFKSNIDALDINESEYSDGTIKTLTLSTHTNIDMYISEVAWVTNDTSTVQKNVKITHSTEDYDPPEAEVRMYLPVYDTECSSTYTMAIESNPASGGINWLLLSLGLVFGCLVCSGLIGAVVYIYKKHPELRMDYVEPEKKDDEKQRLLK